MKKDKDLKQDIFITDQEKNDHPIFNAIYKKIRNLNKKLSAIEQMQKMKVHEFNAQQLKKIERKAQIEKQIKRNEEFAIFYKELLIQNSLKYDKTEDLIRISTLIAIGNHIKQSEYCPKETNEVYQTYNKLFNSHKFDHLADSVTHNYRVLNKYLADQKSYVGCRDYMTYLPEIKIETENHKLSKLANDLPIEMPTHKSEIIQKSINVEQIKIIQEQKLTLNTPMPIKEDFTVQNIVKLQQKQLSKSPQKHQIKQNQQNTYTKTNNRRKNNQKTQYKSKNYDNYYENDDFRETTPKKKKIMYKQKI